MADTATIDGFYISWRLDLSTLMLLIYLDHIEGNKMRLILYSYNKSLLKMFSFVPLTNKNSSYVAKKLCLTLDHTMWHLLYNFTEKESRCMTKVSATLCPIIDAEHVVTTTYQPQIKEKAERFNLAIVTSLLQYIFGDQRD